MLPKNKALQFLHCKTNFFKQCKNCNSSVKCTENKSGENETAYFRTKANTSSWRSIFAVAQQYTRAESPPWLQHSDLWLTRSKPLLTSKNNSAPHTVNSRSFTVPVTSQLCHHRRTTVELLSRGSPELNSTSFSLARATRFHNLAFPFASTLKFGLVQVVIATCSPTDKPTQQTREVQQTLVWFSFNTSCHS